MRRLLEEACLVTGATGAALALAQGKEMEILNKFSSCIVALFRLFG